MYAALFEIKSWLGTNRHFFEGHSASALLEQLEGVQNLSCLVRMGKANERTNAGKKAIRALEALLEKEWNGNLTIKDLQSLDVHLEIGDIKCVTVVEGDEAIAQLKASVGK